MARRRRAGGWLEGARSVSLAALMGANVFSVNSAMKLLVHERFFDGEHFVWCSDQWDSKVLSPYDAASKVPVSSNPKDIYRAMIAAQGDGHDPRIKNNRSMFLKLGRKRVKDGLMLPDQYEEMVVQLDSKRTEDWRPLLYVIARAPLVDRLQLVPPKQRAGVGPEYIIQDLRRDEFDIVEY